MTWKEIQDALGIEMPLYLRNLLTISGYDNNLSLREIKNEDINELQEFARRSVADLISANDMEAYFGIYKNKPQNFVIVPGHRKLIVAISNYLKNVHVASVREPQQKHLRIEVPVSRTVVIENDIQQSMPANSTAYAIPTEDIVSDVQPPFHANDGDEQNLECDYNSDIVVLRTNLAKWLITNRHFMKDKMNANDLDISVFSDNSLAGRTYNLSVAVVKCKKCRSKVKLAMTCPGRHWVTSNFHRHMRRAHFKISQFPTYSVTPRKRKRVPSGGVGDVASSTCALVSEVHDSIARVTEILETPAYNPMLKVEMPSTSEDKGLVLEDEDTLVSYY